MICSAWSFRSPGSRCDKKPGLLLAGWDTEVPGRANLTDVLRHVPITVLLGTSGSGGAFKAVLAPIPMVPAHA